MRFAASYRDILAMALISGIEQRNHRTDEQILIVPGGICTSFDLREGLPLIDCRLTHPKTSAAEVAWFLSGTQSTDWLSQHTKIWKHWEEPILVPRIGRRFLGSSTHTEVVGVKAAYGYRWGSHFGVNQIEAAMQALANDPSSRRVWVSTWDPNEDLVDTGQKNVPCPIGFSVYLVGSYLFSTYVLRSSDLFVGLPYDVMSHSFLLSAMAETLGLKPGGITVVASHAHLYSKHKDLAIEAIKQPEMPDQTMILPPLGWGVGEIRENPDSWLSLIQEQVEAKQDWPSFNPKPFLAV